MSHKSNELEEKTIPRHEVHIKDSILYDAFVVLEHTAIYGMKMCQLSELTKSYKKKV